MKNNQTLLPFVDAFYQLAKEQKKLKKSLILVKQTLESLDQTNFVNFLANYNIELETKKKVLQKIYHKDLLFINWILVLIEDKVVRSLDFILRKFIQIYNFEYKIVEGQIFSARKLNNNQIKKITDAIKNKWQKKIYLEAKIDAELIGGAKIIVGDNVWDNSILKKLNDLTEELVNKKGLITLDGKY
ncbi:MAG: hypothetical protein HPPSJP_1230 [Candidatus Hepatoplasma scabrum]|nr:MAG: hypothetical protein HPPSJP_1230 [Candidatus Hepatoplasma sp.]